MKMLRRLELSLEPDGFRGNAEARMTEEMKSMTIEQVPEFLHCI